MPVLKKTFAILFLSVLSVFSFAQQQTDSLVRLLSAASAKAFEINGESFRKVSGHAQFLHNNTYLNCDTALWRVDRKIIDAIGNVSIVQDGTILTSESLVYHIDRDLAEFRGQIVQLTDRDNNTLKTRHLDYNTKDSVAVFHNGGSMRDKDGQIIESRDGTYDSKIRTFTFSGNVNMFTDSIFVKTTYLKYESDSSLATFGRQTDAWQEENMLSSDAGWYDRGREIFFFTKNVHLMTDTQEAWSDSLYFYRKTSDVEMLGRVQVSDTSRNVHGLAGRMDYVDSTSQITMTRMPSVLAVAREGEKVDTVYFGADTLIYRTIPRCDVDSAYNAQSAARLRDLDVDPVGTYRKKAAEEAAKAAEEAAKLDPNYRPKNMGAKRSGGENVPEDVPESVEDSSIPAAPDSSETLADSLVRSASPALRDSLSLSDSLSVCDSLELPALPSLRDSLAVPDSLSSLSDSLAVVDSMVVMPPPDTTKMGFLTALRNVKVFRRDMQVVCDSLEYSDVDSLARLFKNPAVWNEVKQQYSADSITLVIHNGTMERASLMSDAFIHIQEDETHFNQIKSTEMMAYFSEDSELTRFDALGGATALFFLREHDVLATVNRKEAKMLSATFVNGGIDRAYYYDAVKSDAFPLAQMTKEEQALKGFNWTPERRPVDRYAVTTMTLRPAERSHYASRPRAQFRETDLYFPGYMKGIYTEIQERKIREAERARLAELQKTDTLSVAADSLSADVLADSVSVKDALSDSLAISDSLSKISASADSLSTTAADSEISVDDSKEARKQARLEQREAARAARIKAREDRWAELDKRDAEKLQKKLQKKAAKLRERKRKALEEARRQALKDAAVLEKYLNRLRAREEGLDASQAGE